MKRRRPENIDKEKLAQLLRDKSEKIKLRPFEQFLEREGLKTIWVKNETDESFTESVGFIYCDNQACSNRKVEEKVRNFHP